MAASIYSHLTVIHHSRLYIFMKNLYPKENGLDTKTFHMCAQKRHSPCWYPDSASKLYGLYQPIFSCSDVDCVNVSKVISVQRMYWILCVNRDVKEKHAQHYHNMHCWHLTISHILCMKVSHNGRVWAQTKECKRTTGTRERLIRELEIGER